MEQEIERRDVIIVGSGPAGLSAAVFTKLDGWDTLIFESDWVGGQGTIAYTVANYPGFPPGDGKILMENMREQVILPPPAGVGAELRNEKVIDIDPDRLMVSTASKRYIGKAIILATGSNMQKLGVKGEEKFNGKGVSYYAVIDLDSFKGKKVMVVGGGNSTAKSALIAKTKASKVTLIHRKGSMRAYMPMVKKLEKEGIEILYNTEIREIEGEDKVDKVLLVNNITGAEEKMEVDWIVICVGTEPNLELPGKSGLVIDGNFVKVDGQMKTSREGIFACGEIVKGHRHLINVAAQGASAGMAVSEYLALQMVKSGGSFSGSKNGKYADEYAAMLK